jgi:hypothetical protein
MEDHANVIRVSNRIIGWIVMTQAQEDMRYEHKSYSVVHEGRILYHLVCDDVHLAQRIGCPVIEWRILH